MTVIEVSPHPVLLPAVQDTADQRGDGTGGGGTLRRDDGSLARVITSAAHAWVHGVRVDWAAVFAGSSARRVGLPTYAFQRQRFWPDAVPAGGLGVKIEGNGTDVAGRGSGRPSSKAKWPGAGRVSPGPTTQHGGHWCSRRWPWRPPPCAGQAVDRRGGP